MVKSLPCNSGDVGSNPGQGTNIPHAVGLEPIIQNEVSQKEKHQYSIITHIYGNWKDGNDNPVCETAKATQMYRTVFWTLW